MAEGKLIRFNKMQIFLHWTHVAAFLALVITGLILYLPPLSFLASGSGSRLIHRIAAVGYMLLPISYLIFAREGMFASAKDIFFRWDRQDFGWFKGAPAFYFFGDNNSMTPQRKFNTGQRLNYIFIILGSGLIVVTGLVMWFGKGILPREVFQASVILHDLSTIPAVAMTFVHAYLSAIHPVMRASFSSIIDGKMDAEFAKEHHTRWYEEMMAAEKAKA